MDKIILIEPVLAHYRKDVWENFKKERHFDFKIIAGKDYQGIKGLVDDSYKTFDYYSFTFLKHTFYYLKGSVNFIIKEKPLVLISTGVDFHLIHTIIIFLIHRIILRKKFYWWSHGTFGNQGKIGIILRSFFYKMASGNFLYSNGGRENLKRMGISDNKLQVVNNSLNKIEYGYLNYDLFTKSPDSVFTILYCGRITVKKKLEILVKALSLLDRRKAFSFKCIIVGGGNLNNLKMLLEEENISEKVEFTGAKYDAEIHPYFLRSNLFVYPGGIGLSLVQALSFGLPVITTDDLALHGPEIELLEPEINGCFFADDSPEDLADRIEEWYNKLSKNMGDTAKQCVQRIIDFGYLPDVVSSKVLTFLEKELNLIGA